MMRVGNDGEWKEVGMQGKVDVVDIGREKLRV